MPQIGPTEIAIVLVIALLFFGPSKLPSLARSAGKGVRELKEGLSGAGENVVAEVRDEDDSRDEEAVAKQRADAPDPEPVAARS